LRVHRAEDDSFIRESRQAAYNIHPRSVLPSHCRCGMSAAHTQRAMAVELDLVRPRCAFRQSMAAATVGSVNRALSSGAVVLGFT
jgi:hypothetical protein